MITESGDAGGRLGLGEKPHGRCLVPLTLLLGGLQEVVKQVKKMVVKKGQYAVILDPVDKDDKNQLGTKVLKTGLCNFFLHPGECH